MVIALFDDPSVAVRNGIVPQVRRSHPEPEQALWKEYWALMIVLFCVEFITRYTNLPVAPPFRRHYIQTREHISPHDLYVNTGNEVRWKKWKTELVKVRLLDYHPDLISCKKEFRSFGTVGDAATIPPGDYVSLRFPRPRNIQHHVSSNRFDSQSSIVPTAQIQASAGFPSRKWNKEDE